MDRNTPLAVIAQATCQHFGISLPEMFEGRPRNYPRMLAMHLACQHVPRHCVVIADWFRSTETTVRAAHRQIREWLIWPGTVQHIKQIKKRIRQSRGGHLVL